MLSWRFQRKDSEARGATIDRTDPERQRHPRSDLWRIEDEIAALGAAGIRPGLAAVRVGDNPASKLYVNSKIAACEKLGLASFHITPPASITTEELLALVDDLNRRDDVDGILVQMPLPPQMDAKKILDAVIPPRTWTASIPVNVGRLVAGRAQPGGLHARGRDGNSAAQQNSAGRRERGGDGPQRHRGQADGAAAAARERDGDRFAIRRRASCRKWSAAPISWSPPWAAPRW